MINRQEFERVRRDLAEARRSLLQLSPRGYRAPSIVSLIACGGGNTLYTYGAYTFYGLLTGFNITTIPSAIPSGSPLGTNPIGLSWANIYDANGNTSLVWLALQANGSSDLLGSLIQGAPIVSRRSVQVLVSGTTYGTVYLPYQLG